MDFLKDIDEAGVARDILVDVLVESVSADTAKEAAGSSVSNVIRAIPALGVASTSIVIAVCFDVTAAIAVLGATTIWGPFILTAALVANYLEEDVSDDGSANRSVSSTEQWRKVGIGSLNDYGVSMLEPLLDDEYEDVYKSSSWLEKSDSSIAISEAASRIGIVKKKWIPSIVKRTPRYKPSGTN